MPTSGRDPSFQSMDGTRSDHTRKSSEHSMPESKKARVVGFNHVALEVGDIDAALAFYGRIFDFELRSKSATAAISTIAR